jgi:hypothetical protein
MRLDRAGALMSERYVKIFFELEQDEDGYPPASVESLWALPVGAGLFKLDNIPFFATGVAVDDIISAEEEGGVLRYKEVVRPSAHSTLRVIVYDEAEVAQVRSRFKEMGCSTELSHIPGLIAIDVPPTVSLEALKPILEEGRAQERWDYEEACLAD